MPTYRFREIKHQASKNLPCPGCGKKLRRQRTFGQTLNPFNKNADGRVKTELEIVRELNATAAQWETEPETPPRLHRAGGIVTLTDLLPARLAWRERPARKPRHPQHRATDEIDRQRTLRAGADLLIKGLRLQLEEQEDRHAATVARIDARHGEIVRGLEQQLAELERRLSVGVLAEAAATRTQEIPIITPVMPLHQAPFAATDPGRVPPSWAREDDTVPVPVVRARGWRRWPSIRSSSTSPPATSPAARPCTAKTPTGPTTHGTPEAALASVADSEHVDPRRRPDHLPGLRPGARPGPHARPAPLTRRPADDTEPAGRRPRRNPASEAASGDPPPASHPRRSVNATTHEVKASETATPVLVQAIEPVPGLHVYEQPEELRTSHSTSGTTWRLGHHSGLDDRRRHVRGRRDPRRAKKIADRRRLDEAPHRRTAGRDRLPTEPVRGPQLDVVRSPHLLARLI
jgi:hypothetical protein